MHNHPSRSNEKRDRISPTRKAALWNIQSPGDKYDIRKSMIARLPEHPPRFMGDNIQLVCLFQAAEIQRLSQFLQEMSVKVREAERMQLDRHSYEVQIKQLAEKLSLMGNYKTDNEKLKDFIKRQSQEMQNLQKHRNSSQNLIQLQFKYNQLLQQLKLCRQNQSIVQKSNSELLKQLTEWRFRSQKSQRLLIQQRQIFERQLRIKIQSSLTDYRQSTQSRQYQLKGQITVLRQQLALKNEQISLNKNKIDAIIKQLNEKQQQLNKYRLQYDTFGSKGQQLLKISKRLQETTYHLELSNKQNSSLKDQILYFNKTIKTLQEQLRNKQLIVANYSKSQSSQYKLRTIQLQTKIRSLSEQLFRSHQQLQQNKSYLLNKQRQLQQSKQKIIFCQRKYESIERQMKQRQQRYRRMQIDSRVNHDKDSRIQMMARQINRLNDVLQDKMNEIKRLQLKLRESASGQNHQLVILKNKEEAIRIFQTRLKQYDTKILMLQQTSKRYSDDVNRSNMKLITLQNQNIQLRRQVDMSRQQLTSGQNLKIQFGRINEQYTIKVVQNKKLRQDNEKMYKQIMELTQSISVIQIQTKQQNLLLNKKLQQKTNELLALEASIGYKERDYIQKIQKFSRSVPQLSVEIERLHQVLEKKQHQFTALKDELENQRQKVRIIQKRNSSQYQLSVLQYQQKISYLQSKCSNYQKQIIEITRQKQSIVLRIESLQVQLSQAESQLHRLQMAIKSKQYEFEENVRKIQMLQNNINHIQTQNMRLNNESLKFKQQYENSQSQIRNLQYQQEKSNQTINQWKNDYLILKQETTRLRQMSMKQQQSLIPQLDSLKSINEQLKSNLNSSNIQIQQLTFELNQLRIRSTSLTQINTSLNIKITQYQERIRHIELTNSRVVDEKRNVIVNEYQLKIKQANQRYTNLQTRYRQLETKLEQVEEKYRNLNQQNMHFKNQLTDNQTHHGTIQKQLSDLQRRYNDIQRQNSEFQRQNGDLQRQIQEYQNKLFQYEQKIQHYEQKCVLLSQQLERLSQTVKTLRNQVADRTNISNQNQSNNRAINEITEQLQETKIQLINLKNMLQEYQSINQHTIAERDELFKISHQQHQQIQQLKGLLQQQNGDNQKEFHALTDKYHAISKQYSQLTERFNLATHQLQDLRRNTLNQSISRQYEMKFKENQLMINKITEQYQTALRAQRTKFHQLGRQVQKYQQDLNAIQQMNGQLTATIKQLTIQINSNVNIQSTEYEELKTNYMNIKIQNQQLNRILEQMQDQMFQLNGQVEQLEQSKQEKVRKAGEENIRLIALVEAQRQKSLRLEQQMNTLQHQFEVIKIETNTKLKSVENYYLPFVEQSQRYKILVDQLTIEIENLTNQMNKLSIHEEISIEWEQKYNTLYQAYNEMYKVYNQMKSEYDTCNKNLREFQIKFPQIETKFNQLSSQVVELKAERQQLLSQLEDSEDLRKKNLHLSEQIDRLISTKQLLKQEISELRIRLSNDHALQRRVQEDMALMVILFAQIQSLRKRVQQTQQECEDVKRNSLSPYRLDKNRGRSLNR